MTNLQTIHLHQDTSLQPYSQTNVVLYGSQLWRCASESTVQMIQRVLNKTLTNILDAPTTDAVASTKTLKLTLLDKLSLNKPGTMKKGFITTWMTKLSSFLTTRTKLEDWGGSNRRCSEVSSENAEHRVKVYKMKYTTSDKANKKLLERWLGYSRVTHWH